MVVLAAPLRLAKPIARFVGFGSVDDRPDGALPRALAELDTTVHGIGTAIDKMGAVQGDQSRKLDALASAVNQLVLTLNPVQADPAIRLSIAEISRQASTYQYDAMRWLDAGDTAAASQRISDAKKLAEAGLSREPTNPLMMVTMGYIEKTQAQIAWESEDGDAKPAKIKNINTKDKGAYYKLP